MKIKRVLSFAVALVVAVSCLLCAGCSTPSIAMKVDDKEYTMGDYLAYMYNVISTDNQITNQLYMLYYGYGESMDKWELSYGEPAEGEKEAPKLSFNKYVEQMTKDQIIRQKAVEELLKKYELKWDDEQVKTVEEDLKEIKPDQFIALGFNNDRFINMYKAVSLNESSLFTGLYDDGGLREVSDADERKWFDEHYYSYKIIEISLVDQQNKDLKEDEITKIKTKLESYQALFNKNGKNGDAFDVAYRAYLADQKAEEAAKTTTASTTSTTTTTTTAATTTTTTTAANDHDHDHDHEDEKTEAEETTPETATRNDYIDEDMDEELLKVLKEMKEGSAAIKTYKKNGTTNTMAFVLRMDPEAERGKDKDGKAIDYYKDCHDQTLQYMKYDEMDKEIKELVETLKDKVVYTDRAIKAAKPKEMMTVLYGI